MRTRKHNRALKTKNGARLARAVSLGSSRSLMRREEGVVDGADADEGNRRAVMQCDGRVAATICDRGTGDARRRIGKAGQRGAVAAGLAERGDRVVAARCRAIIPECFVAAGKADRRRSARHALDRIVSAAKHRGVAAAGQDRVVARCRIEEGVGGAAGDLLAGDASECFVAAGPAVDRIAGTAPDRLVAAGAADDRLTALAAIDRLVAAAAADNGVAGTAADRLVAAAAAADRVAGAAKDRFGAAAAARDRLIAEMSVEQLVEPGAAGQRIA